MKEIVKPSLILLIITAVAALLLGVVSETTKEAIAAQTAKTEQTAMEAVLPGENLEFETLVDASKMTDSEKADLGIVVKVSKALSGGQLYGYVITTAPSGFGGAVNTMVGVDAENTITGLRVLSHAETPGLGAKSTEPSFYEQFTGKSGTLAVTKDGGEINAITSATITSRTVTDGANAALKWVEENGGAN